MEPPLWILLGLSSIHSFENRVLPTGAANRSGLLSLETQSSWRWKSRYICVVYICGVWYTMGHRRKVSTAVLGWGMAVLEMGWGCQGRYLYHYLENPLFPSGIWHATCSDHKSVSSSHTLKCLLQHQSHCQGLGIKGEWTFPHAFKTYTTLSGHKTSKLKMIRLYLWNCQYLATSYLLKSPFCMVQSITQ